MKRLFALGCLVLILSESSAQAQIFGRRTLGQPLDRRPGDASWQSGQLSDTAAANVGTITGNERYIRGNRRATDFVGTDRTEVGTFVGAQQAEGMTETRPAALDVRRRPPVRVPPSVNPPRTDNRRSRRYEPPLVVAFRFTPQESASVGEDLSWTLRSLGSTDRFGQIEASVAGSTATLRGTVPSEEDRQMAERIALLEPSVSSVRNELVVAPPGTVPNLPAAGPAHRQEPPR